MNKEHWSVRETGRRAGISYTLVSNIVNGERPTYDTCVALAEAFSIPKIQILNMAGLLEMPPDWTPSRAQWNAAFDDLSPDDQAELLEIARLKLSRKRKPGVNQLKPAEGG